MLTTCLRVAMARSHTLSGFQPPHGQVCKGYPSAREALVVNGKFLLRQLATLDGKNGKGKGKAAASLSDGAFAKALATEVRVCVCEGGNAAPLHGPGCEVESWCTCSVRTRLHTLHHTHTAT